MKAQLFIVSMIFLVGLVFTVQNALFQFTEIDLSDSYNTNDAYIFANVKDSFRKTVQSAHTCEQASEDLADLEDFFSGRIVAGYNVDIVSELDCANWDSGTNEPLKLTIQVFGQGTDSREIVHFFN